MSKIILLFCFSLCLFPILSQDRPVREVREVRVPSSIELAIEKLANDPDLKNASISFYVYDSDNDVMIEEYNSKQSLVTASTMKVVTTATVLQYLGSYHKFKTQLSYDGFIDSNCVLHGKIYIEGGGDPTLCSKYFNKDDEDFMNDWISSIENLGIHSIDGKIVGDDSYFSDEFVPASWGWGDMGNYYGAGVSGLSIYDNTTTYTFDAGNENNDLTEVTCYEPYAPGLVIDNRVLAGNTTKDEAYIYGGPYDNYRLIKGRIPKGATEFEVRGATNDPA